MAEQRPGGFRIRFDEEPTDVSAGEPIADRRLDKLSRRVTLVAVLLPLLVAVVLFLVYADIKQRVSLTQTEGISELETLSKNLESRFSQLSVQQAKLEEMANKKIADIEKRAAQLNAELQTAMKASEASIKKLLTEKAGQKEITAEIQKLGKSVTADLETLKSDIKQINASIAKAKKDFAKGQAALDQSLKKSAKRIDTVQKSVSKLDKGKINANQLENALEKERDYARKTLGKTGTDLKKYAEDAQDNKKNIELNQKKILEIQRSIRSIQSSLQTKTNAAANSNLTRSAAEPATPGAASPGQSSDSIQEQELKE